MAGSTPSYILSASTGAVFVEVDLSASRIKRKLLMKINYTAALSNAIPVNVNTSYNRLTLPTLHSS